MILITRPYIQGLNTKAKLKAQGIKSICYPLIRIEPIQSLHSTSFSKYHAIIVTSQNSVFVFNRYDELKLHKLFIVGSKTSEALKSIGACNIVSVCDEHSKLITELKRSVPQHSKLLYIRGEHTACDLQKELLLEYQIKDLIVYKSIARKSISHRITQLIDSHITYILFYSLRTAQVFTKHFANTNLSKITALCISSKVAKSLSCLNFQKIMIAPRPNEDDMLKVVGK